VLCDSPTSGSEVSHKYLRRHKLPRKHLPHFFDLLLTVHLSIFISVINQLDAQNFCFKLSFISCLYMFRAHTFIIRRSKLHYTASGIIKPIGGRLVHRLREDGNMVHKF